MGPPPVYAYPQPAPEVQQYYYSYPPTSTTRAPSAPAQAATTMKWAEGSTTASATNGARRAAAVERAASARRPTGHTTPARGAARAYDATDAKYAAHVHHPAAEAQLNAGACAARTDSHAVELVSVAEAP